MAKQKPQKTIASYPHTGEKRKNIPTAELQSVVDNDTKAPRPQKYPRNTDLDPQLVWRGKDEQDWSDLVVQAPPLYIQEKILPKALIDDLLRRSEADNKAESGQPDLFADFNGIPEGVDKTEFYRHDQNWSNRMILGDSLQVMASLAEREALKGKVQCVYIDPPYGIKFNSNFQWSTTSRDVKDGKPDHITREPEQVKAFRDTWRDGIHSYLSYLRDRLTVAKDLLHESGSVFVQIGDENVHRVRALMDEVFGEENFVSQINFRTAMTKPTTGLNNVFDYIIWYSKSKINYKYRPVYIEKEEEEDDTQHQLQASVTQDVCSFTFRGTTYNPVNGWRCTIDGLRRLKYSERLYQAGFSKVKIGTLKFIREKYDFPYAQLDNTWNQQSSEQNKIYVVQTAAKIITRCILMTTDPGDLVLDPTCGSGTTAYVAEQWGRRWITIDTSRVALALARSRLMGARYPYYRLVDSDQGIVAEENSSLPANHSPLSTRPSLRRGFVYEQVPHITLKSIANNAEIDIIWEKHRGEVEAAREKLNAALRGHKTPFKVENGGRQGKLIDFSAPAGKTETLPSGETVSASELLEWEIPRAAPADWPKAAATFLAAFWQARIKRQKEIDASIAAKAEFERLYDKPFEDKRKIRVSGPFTVESISPHRVLGVDENGDVIDPAKRPANSWGEIGEGEPSYGFTEIILENLKAAGVQSVHKEDKINFNSLAPWPGSLVCAEGRYWEGDEKTGTERRAAVFIGPEFGTVSRPDLIEAAREAADSDFDVLIACAFNYEAHATEFEKLGKIKILKARMNADLHMAADLRNNGKGNLFVIFGEPDIVVASEEWLVDSNGRRIAPYEIFKIVSGLDSVAEIKKLGDTDLQMYARISVNREVWNCLTNEAGGDIDSGKHCGGTGPQYDGGVSPVAWVCAGFPGGTGNVYNNLRRTCLSQTGEFGRIIERLRRDWENVKFPAKVTIYSPLATKHFSQVHVKGVDVFHPNTGEIRSDGPEGIACWFIDTDYNEESFFVRHAYFLGAGDPYGALKTSLRAEINEDAWATLRGDTSRPFDKPASGRIAVKVINHLGDEVMKVFRVR